MQWLSRFDRVRQLGESERCATSSFLDVGLGGAPCASTPFMCDHVDDRELNERALITQTFAFADRPTIGDVIARLPQRRGRHHLGKQP